jgi:DNA polymerase III alpha subunit
MNTNKYGAVFLSQEEFFESLYSGKIKNTKNIYLDTETVDRFNSAVKSNRESFPLLEKYQQPEESIEFFDEANQCTWFMPEEYQKFPIVEWLFEQCKTEEQRQRVEDELKLFIQHGMFDLLFYLKYLVDTMRSNNIVWGVGRGSSVASYVLYLIGIHRIDSIKYSLDIKEFLK